KDMLVLEEQALAPMLGEDPVELGMAGHEARIYATLAADPVYQQLHAAAYPDTSVAITRKVVTTALAAFERSIVSFNAPYDRWRFYGETAALDASASRGMAIFFSDKGRCHSCHLAENVSPDLGL